MSFSVLKNRRTIASIRRKTATFGFENTGIVLKNGDNTVAPELVGTTLILIRHAERDAPTPLNPDPHLNAAGRARAQELVHVLGTTGIAAIYHSQFVRSRETAKPLAVKLPGVPRVELLQPSDIRNDVLLHHKGKTVLVIGHSDTVPALIGLMGGGAVPVIPDAQFDNLFVVTVLSSTLARVTKLEYDGKICFREK